MSHNHTIISHKPVSAPNNTFFSINVAFWNWWWERTVMVDLTFVTWNRFLVNTKNYFSLSILSSSFQRMQNFLFCYVEYRHENCQSNAIDFKCNFNEMYLHVYRIVAYNHLRPSRVVNGVGKKTQKIFKITFSLDDLPKRSLQVNAYYMTKKKKKKSMSKRSARANCKLFFWKKY